MGTHRCPDKSLFVITLKTASRLGGVRNKPSHYDCALWCICTVCLHALAFSANGHKVPFVSGWLSFFLFIAFGPWIEFLYRCAHLALGKIRLCLGVRVSSRLYFYSSCEKLPLVLNVVNLSKHKSKKNWLLSFLRFFSPLLRLRDINNQQPSRNCVSLHVLHSCHTASVLFSILDSVEHPNNKEFQMTALQLIYRHAKKVHCCTRYTVLRVEPTPRLTTPQPW